MNQIQANEAYYEDPEEADAHHSRKRARTSTDDTIAPSVTDSGNGTPAHNLSAPVASRDSVDYPRRRAVIACDICRLRKSRCDGARPKCRLCTDLGADCVYREPGLKLDAGDKLILEKLTHIEELLQTSLNKPATNHVVSSTSPLVSTSGPKEDTVHATTNHEEGDTSYSSLPFQGMGTWSSNISAMPKGHTTPAMHLLQWPVIRELIAQPCDPRTLLQLELNRQPLELSGELTLDFNNVDTYAKSFFEDVNVWYAMVNPYNWYAYYQEASNAGFRSGTKSCMILLTLALGKAAHETGSVSEVPSDQPPPGYDFFSAAWSLMAGLALCNDIQTAQCHVLAAAYLLFLVRPLEAWNLLSYASSKLQLLLSLPNSIPAGFKELSERIYWNTLMIESDLLAELDLPHTGVSQFEDSIRLPRSFPYHPTEIGNIEPPGNDELWYFLAEVALRRLLNRVSHMIYTSEHSPDSSIGSLGPVIAELDLQLTQWYDSLPSQIKFSKERLPSSSQSAVQKVLRLRYFACRTIIFRRHVLAVLADETLASEPSVQDACFKCLECCIQQLESIDTHRAGHLPYIWQGALSVTSQALLVMGATLSPVLSALLPSADQVDNIIADVVEEAGRLAHLAPSLKLCADILEEAEQRRRSRLGKTT